MTSRPTHQLVRAAVLFTGTLLTSCIGVSLGPIPLGPNAASAMVVNGGKILAPTTGCTGTPGSPYNGMGYMQLGPENPNTYIAVLDVENRTATNETVRSAPAYGDKYGAVDSTPITLVGAEVTLDFPSLSPQDNAALKFAITNNRPSDGLILTNLNGTLGNSTLRAAVPAAVGVKLIDPAGGLAIYNKLISISGDQGPVIEDGTGKIRHGHRVGPHRGPHPGWQRRHLQQGPV
jgi:hypothetical protein